MEAQRRVSPPSVPGKAPQDGQESGPTAPECPNFRQMRKNAA
ncbi:hypothetical protein SAMN05421795_107124 [Phaeovulum vinaykumarii]|uniref:Uncharacterized protein n=1 Tax=Phaeovulum vinaykumarii TaxID=407234 RepID=A0A1N7MHG8_9RHOB|nr:hypothetical protein SAMN05421795_107124 [Phaeovulum vinaykumarii]